MKLFQVNDVHSSDVPPRWRTSSYRDDIFEKLWQIEAAVCRTARLPGEESVVLFTGDLFHRPVPNKTSHKLVQLWLELLEALTRFATVIVVPGNHDLISEETTDGQPIETLSFMSGVKVLFGSQCFYKSDENLKIAGFSWRASANAEFVKDFLLHEDIVQDYNYPSWHSCKFDVLALHGAVSLNKNPFYLAILAQELNGIARVVCYGHLHPTEKPYLASGEVIELRAGEYMQHETVFVNPGALSRGSFIVNDLNRVPQIALIDIDKFNIYSIDYIPLEARPAEEVYRMQEFREKKGDSSEFINTLSDSSIESITTDIILDEVSRMSDGNVELGHQAKEILTAVS